MGGCKAGWIVSRVGNHILDDQNADYEEVKRQIRDGFKELPPWPLRIDIDTSVQHQTHPESPVRVKSAGSFYGEAKSENVQTVTIDRRPAGITFRGTDPVEVASVLLGSPADMAGIKEGHQVIRMGDVDVTDCHDAAHIHQL